MTIQYHTVPLYAECSPYKEAVDPMVGPRNEQLCKHHRPLGMYSTVCDPILLGQSGGGVNDELLSGLVIVGGGLHLNSIVACMGAEERVLAIGRRDERREKGQQRYAQHFRSRQCENNW